MWFAIDEPKSGSPAAIGLAGTESWGSVTAIVSSPSNNPDGVDAQYIGFVLDRKDAEKIVAVVNGDLISAEKD